jgi:hypothetical protein
LQVPRSLLVLCLLLLKPVGAACKLRGDAPAVIEAGRASTADRTDAEPLSTGRYPSNGPQPLIRSTRNARFFVVSHAHGSTSGSHLPVVDAGPGDTYAILLLFRKLFQCGTAKVGTEMSYLTPGDRDEVSLCPEVRADARPSRRTFHLSWVAPQAPDALPKLGAEVRDRLLKAAKNTNSFSGAQSHPKAGALPVSPTSCVHALRALPVGCGSVCGLSNTHTAAVT